MTIDLGILLNPVVAAKRRLFSRSKWCVPHYREVAPRPNHYPLFLKQNTKIRSQSQEGDGIENKAQLPASTSTHFFHCLGGKTESAVNAAG